MDRAIFTLVSQLSVDTLGSILIFTPILLKNLLYHLPDLADCEVNFVDVLKAYQVN